MGRYKYYMSYQHDHEDCIEGNSDEEYHKIVNKDGSPLTQEQSDTLCELWNNNSSNKYYEYQDEQNLKWIDVPNMKVGEKLIIRVDKKGNSWLGNKIIEAWCDFEEHHRERIKCPKGYMKRNGKRKMKKWLKNY